jgi:hypothetical protein
MQLVSRASSDEYRRIQRLSAQLSKAKSQPIPAPDRVLFFGSTELEVDLDDILEALLELWLLEPRCEAGEGQFG